MRQCSLCDEIGGSSSHFGDDYCDLVESGSTCIACTNTFIVVPSIGALNESHVMIVPRFHTKSLAENIAESVSELAQLMQCLSEFAARKYEWRLVFFEHGTGNAVDTSGACVEHAHLHVVRAVPGLGKLLLDASWTPLLSIRDLSMVADRSHGYLYFRDDTGNSFVLNNPRVQPQHFRKCYSALQGGSAAWNWRLNFRLSALRSVVDTYAEFAVT